MKKGITYLLAFLLFFILPCNAHSFNDDEYEVSAKSLDFNPGDGFMDAGTSSNPYVIKRSSPQVPSFGPSQSQRAANTMAKATILAELLRQKQEKEQRAQAQYEYEEAQRIEAKKLTEEKKMIVQNQMNEKRQVIINLKKLSDDAPETHPGIFKPMFDYFIKSMADMGYLPNIIEYNRIVQAKSELDKELLFPDVIYDTAEQKNAAWLRIIEAFDNSAKEINGTFPELIQLISDDKVENEKALIIADFDSGDTVNSIGGSFGVRDISSVHKTQGCQMSFTPHNASENLSGSAMQIDYGSNSENTNCGFWMKLNGLNAKPYSALVFNVRTDVARNSGNQIVNVELIDSGMVRSQYAFNFLGTNHWQKIQILLTNFNGIQAWDALNELVITFDTLYSGPKVGSVYVDNVYLAKIDEIPQGQETADEKQTKSDALLKKYGAEDKPPA